MKRGKLVLAPEMEPLPAAEQGAEPAQCLRLEDMDDVLLGEPAGPGDPPRLEEEASGANSNSVDTVDRPQSRVQTEAGIYASESAF